VTRGEDAPGTWAGSWATATNAAYSGGSQKTLAAAGSLTATFSGIGGGVLCTNSIGDSAILRVAEAALQVRGDAGEHQVTREVKQALASGFGGSYWSDLLLLSKTTD
jgi:hypothetical protein